MQSLLLRASGRTAAFRCFRKNETHIQHRCWANRTLSTASALNSEKGLPKRSKVNSVLFFGIPVCVTFSLGVWQVRRLSWKKELIKERKQGLELTPLTEADLATSSVPDHRRITISGTLLHEKEMLVGPRSAPKDMPSSVLQWCGSSGFLVVTPLRTAGGKIVLVNRGWIPQRLANREKRRDAKISPLPLLETEGANTVDYRDEEKFGQVEFTGVTRSCDEKNRFMPENNPEKNDWFYVDANAMLAAQSLTSLDEPHAKLPFIELVQPLPENGWPYPRSFEHFLQFRTPPSTHVTYATTWFLLSASLALLSRHRIRRASARERKPR